MMNNGQQVVLSVLVVSHNQCSLLPRCLDSVLAQELDVPFEVIVSDDRSTDGTWELIEEYQERFPDIIRGVKCNSDECVPVSRSERCGWNKATAYRNARGEYVVNIDADDYLKSKDIYQMQLDALRANPDCSMCQQRVWQVRNGEPLSLGYAWPKSPKLKNGAKLTAGDLILRELRGVNPTYMMRRNPGGVNPADEFGKWFDDTVITLYHLQFGKVVFVDREDYVWVQYRNSISNSDEEYDRMLLYALLPVHHALLIPKYKTLFMQQVNRQLSKLLQLSLFHRLPLLGSTVAYCKECDGFIFHYYAEGQKGVTKRVRLLQALLCYRRLHKHRPCRKEDAEQLYSLLVNR